MDATAHISFDKPEVWKIKLLYSNVKTFPCALATDLDRVYICSRAVDSILAYTADGSLVKEAYLKRTLNEPVAIDYANSRLYIVNKTNLSIFTISGEWISSFDLPTPKCRLLSSGLKVDGDLLYLTLTGYNQIFTYTFEGTLIRELGTSFASHSNGAFDQPYGLTINESDLYVCDYHNNRIQILDKHNGQFQTQWGKKAQLNRPFAILYAQDTIYVGDRCSVQLYTPKGKFLQRIGGKVEGKLVNQFSKVSGICVIKDCLYVSESGNHRVTVFRPSSRCDSVRLNVENKQASEDGSPLTSPLKQLQQTAPFNQSARVEDIFEDDPIDDEDYYMCDKEQEKIDRETDTGRDQEWEDEMEDEGFVLLERKDSRVSGVTCTSPMKESSSTEPDSLTALLPQPLPPLPPLPPPLDEEQKRASEQSNLGLFYEYGTQGFSQDFSKAIECYTTAAQQGSSDALTGLARCYQEGKGVEKDSQEALRLYKLAAKQNNANAFYNLGICYLEGNCGVSIDSEKGIYWLTLAAQLGHEGARGEIYQRQGRVF